MQSVDALQEHLEEEVRVGGPGAGFRVELDREEGARLVDEALSRKKGHAVG